MTNRLKYYVLQLGDPYPYPLLRFMMFGLARADVLPHGDLVVRKAFKRLYGCSQGLAPLSQTLVAEHADLPGRGEMEAIAERWRPYRTLGSWYMWHVLETKEAAYVY